MGLILRSLLLFRWLRHRVFFAPELTWFLIAWRGSCHSVSSSAVSLFLQSQLSRKSALRVCSTYTCENLWCVIRVNRFIAVTLNKLCLLQFPFEINFNAVQPRFLFALLCVCVKSWTKKMAWNITEKSCGCQTVAKHLLSQSSLTWQSAHNWKIIYPLFSLCCVCVCLCIFYFFESAVCALLFHLLHSFNEFGFPPSC